MNLRNKILYGLSKKILGRNKKFKNLHRGEKCYLIGNGASLKYFDLKKFEDKISIGCNSLFLHSDFNKIDVQYYFVGDPFFFYRYWKNMYTRKIELNKLGLMYQEKMAINDNVLYFTNLSNYLTLKGEENFFFHHFGQPFDNYNNCNLDRQFTTMASGLSGMLGIAIYMGFKDITLLGCDYTFYPQAVGHFFDFGKNPDIHFSQFQSTFLHTYNAEPNSEQFLQSAQNHATLKIVVPNNEYKGHILPYITYQELTGSAPSYKENNQIVSKADLLSLSVLKLPYVIFPNK